jgi:hypothetical protein
MIVVYSKNNVPIRITQERWMHITKRHSEMENQKEKISETISNPEFILVGDFGEFLAGRFYHETPLTNKYLIVAYKEISAHDGYVLTAYFSNEPSQRRKVIWKR